MRQLVCAMVLVLVGMGLGAQESGASPDIGTVDITAQAYSPLVLVPAGKVTVLSADDIATTGASSAAEALTMVPGVTVSSHGPGGGQATIAIGASSANQVLVIMDGVRLNDALQGAPDLSQVPASMIDRIEVLGTGASAAYGADAVGGVVIITTKKSGASRLSLGVGDTAYPTALGLAGAGSLADSQKFTLDAGSRIAQADVAFSAQAERGSDAYPFTAGGADVLRSNAGYWDVAGTLSTGLPAAGGRLESTVMGSHLETGVPGSTISYPLYLSSTETQTNTAVRGSLGWSSDALAGGALGVAILGHGSYSRLDYFNLSAPSYYQITSAGVDTRWSWIASGAVNVGFGSSLLYDSADSPDFATRAEGQPKRLSLGAYAEPTVLVGDRLKLTPSIRYDWNDTYVSGLTAMLGLVLEATDRLDLRLTGGRSFRAPTFEDLYDYFHDPVWNYTYTGNPRLKPETAYSGELGADWHADALKVSATLRGRYVEDLISYYSDPVTYDGTEINLGRAFISNADVDLGYTLGAARFAANYDFIYPLDVSNGSSLAESPVIPYYSRHSAKLSADLSLGSATLGLSSRFTSKRVDQATPTQTVPDLFLLDLHSSIAVATGTRLTLDIDNLLDTRYQVVYGYPMPGITVKLGMRLDL
ncbi:MAG TPA: TonB-dependent receptor [Rectinemataceae bacterium]|nr:TonB-dependent receptor [Rectinemataceae bacterium]